MEDSGISIESHKPSFRAFWEDEFIPYKEPRLRKQTECKDEDIEKTNQKLHLAESICRDGSKHDAIVLCREYLWELLQATPIPDRFHFDRPPTVRLMGDMMRQILRIYAYEVDPAPFRDLGSVPSAPGSFLDDFYPNLGGMPSASDFFLEQWFRMELDARKDSAELLHTYQVLLCAILRFFSNQWARRFASKVLGHLEHRFGRDSEEVKFLVKFLAENYIFGDGRHEISCGEPTIRDKANTIVNRHLSSVKRKPLDLYSLRYFYGLGTIHLERHEKIDATALFQHTFDGRIQVLGETHAASSKFIKPILESFCSKNAGKMVFDGEPDPHALIHDLVKFCLEEEKFNEVEILIEECLWHDGIFELFTERQDRFISVTENSIQYTLATHRSPGHYVYWRDTRLYTHQWSTLCLIPAYPKETFPCSPIKLNATSKSLDIEITPNSLADLKELLCTESDQEVLDKVQNCTTWYYIAHLHARGRVLSKFCNQWSCKELEYWSLRHHGETPEHKKAQNVTLWLFLDGHFDETPVEKAATALCVPHDKPLPKFSISVAGKPLSDTDYAVWGPPDICVKDAAVWKKGYTFNYFKDEDKDVQTKYTAGAVRPLEWGMSRYYGPLSKDSDLSQALHERAEPFQCSITGIGERYIDVTTSYIPYEHYCESRAFREGFTYLEYMDVMKKIIIGIRYCMGYLDPFENIRPRMCSSAPSPDLLASYNVTRELSHSDQRQGARGMTLFGSFFNGIPCGLAFLSSQDALKGFHLVSSHWRDWSNFTLYRPSRSDTPQLVLENGEVANCRGYIMGSLYKDDLSLKWTGVRIFVVDVLFKDPGSGCSANFLFDASSFSSLRVCKGKLVYTLFDRLDNLSFYSSELRETFHMRRNLSRIICSRIRTGTKVWCCFLEAIQ